MRIRIRALLALVAAVVLFTGVVAAETSGDGGASLPAFLDMLADILRAIADVLGGGA